MQTTEEMPMTTTLRADQILPQDGAAFLVGRVWSNLAGGPCPVWLEAARRLHRIALLGITSGRETLRETIRAVGPTTHPEFARAETS
jgi:fumarylacetoacetate (FAA) hydrolase family protein